MPDAPKPVNHMAEATLDAVRHTRERLAAGVDLARSARLGGLTVDVAGRVEVNYLGRALRVVPGEVRVEADDGGPVRADDEMLVLRYLEIDREVRPTGETITFRGLPGGAFYFGPISKRTTDVLLKVFGNDLERLKKAMARYPHEELALGDYAAKIQALGRITVTIVYHHGDDEFPPAMDFIYDRVIGSVYNTDEVAALATRIAFGLIR